MPSPRALTAAAAAAALASAAPWEPTAVRHIPELTVATQPADASGVVRAAALLGGSPVATAEYAPTYNTTGWATLRVAGNASFGDDQVAYAAGYIEGQTTWEALQLFILNSGSNFTWDANLAAFMEANDAFMRGAIGGAPDDAYWHAVSGVLRQLEGLYWGYADACAAAAAAAAGRGDGRIACYPFRALMNVQLSGDMEDLTAALAIQAGATELPGHPRDEQRGRVARRRTVTPGGLIQGDAGHCSALVKLLPGNAELFFSQVTWSAFETMTRIFKRYDLPYSLTGDRASGTVPAVSMTMSSYPGSLFSGDDFYQMSSGLAMLETTIGNNNATLYALYVRPATVLEWVRNLVANRLAASGAGWVEVYSKFNSGTYNNENVIVDYNLFTPGSPPPDGVLTVADQIPGFVVSADLTYQLRTDTYFPSYNSPVFPWVFNMSGDVDPSCGAWCTYNFTARAEIFARDHAKVVDGASMERLMRYNDFQHDPLAKIGCGSNPPFSAENGISARDDLNPAGGVYPISALGQRDHAGIDAKVTSWAMMWGKQARGGAAAAATAGGATALTVRAQSGPTYDQQPVFVYSASPYANTTSHVGMPDVWQFPWVTIEW